MRWLAMVVLLFSTSARAEFVSMQKDTLSAADLNAADCSVSTNWTGWVDVAKWRSVVWEIFFNGDAAPATTGITMRCETSEAASTANDSGYDLHILSDSATVGTSTSTTHTWNNPVTADERWTWTVANLPHNYINCLFTCTAGDANDALTIKHKKVSP